MKAAHRELQQLKGIGDVLSRRLVEEGLDTFARIVAAGRDGLERIKGVNPRAIDSILQQAAEHAANATVDKDSRLAELQQGIAGLRIRVQDVAADARERFHEELAGKKGRKLTKELLQVVDALDGIARQLPKRIKRTGKGLAKAEERLGSLAEAKLGEIRRGLRKSGKTLKRVLK